MWRWVGTVALALVAAFWLCGTNSPQPPGAGDARAQHALEAVTTATFDPRHPEASFPHDFHRVMGYRPAVATGPHGSPILIKPTGDCSSFTGRTEYDFSTVCKEHDLSYDVIRYAHRVGAPLDAGARQAADDMFGRELHARCGQLQVSGTDWLMCHTFAESFVDVVRVNSWRQGYRSPEQESPWRWSAMLLLTGGFVGLRAIPTYLQGRRRRQPFAAAGLLVAHPVRLAPLPGATVAAAARAPA